MMLGNLMGKGEKRVFSGNERVRQGGPAPIGYMGACVCMCVMVGRGRS